MTIYFLNSSKNDSSSSKAVPITTASAPALKALSNSFLLLMPPPTIKGIFIFFFTFYLAAQFNGAGKVLNVTFGIPNIYGILIGTIVIVSYTMMGGFLAVAWTDMIQGIIMIGALVILPLVGFIEIMEQHKSLDAALAATGTDFADVTGGARGFPAPSHSSRTSCR